MFFVKISLIITLLSILHQDYKDREVYWFLYPFAGMLFFILQYQQSGITVTLTNLTFNLFFISIILLCAYCYNLIRLKLNFLKEVLGIGDILFFIFICFGFSPVSFIVLFVFSLVFALAIHLSLTNKKQKSVPLAGYMSLFFCIVLLFGFFMNVSFLYAF